MVNSDSAISGDTMEAIQLRHCQDVETLIHSSSERRRETALDCTHLYHNFTQWNSSGNMSTSFQLSGATGTISGAASAPGFSGSSAKSSYTCGYIFSLLYVLTHLRAQSITSLHLWEQAKNALSSTARPAHTVADTLCITGCRMNAFSGWCSCFKRTTSCI